MSSKLAPFYVGQPVPVEVVSDIYPESEFWEKGYWKIPKGHKTVVTDKNEDGDYLIEYCDAKFYVEPNCLCPISNTD